MDGIRRFLFVVIAALPLGACAVVMASKHRGVEVETLTACQTKACFQGLPDVTPLEVQSEADGSEVITYRALMKQGSTSRAVMHGLLDVATLGIWEVAGTPIESNKRKKRYIILDAHFAPDGTVRRVVVESAGQPNPKASNENDDAA